MPANLVWDEMALRLATDRIWSSPAAIRPELAVIHLAALAAEPTSSLTYPKGWPAGGEGVLLFRAPPSLFSCILHLLFLFPLCQALLLIDHLVSRRLEVDSDFTSHLLRGSNIHSVPDHDCVISTIICLILIFVSSQRRLNHR